MTTFKNLLIAIVLLTLPGISFAGNCPGADFAASGTIQIGVEAGCWAFVTDDGESYTLLGAPSSVLRNGLSGVLTGYTNTEIITFCMQGPVISLCDFDANNQVSKVGTLRYEPDTGCWLLHSGNEVYLVYSEIPGFYENGAKVKINAVPSLNTRTNCEVDAIFDVLSFELIGNNNKAAGSNPGQCYSQFAKCNKACAEVYCQISCEQLFTWCMQGL